MYMSLPLSTEGGWKWDIAVAMKILSTYILASNDQSSLIEKRTPGQMADFRGWVEEVQDKPGIFSPRRYGIIQRIMGVMSEEPRSNLEEAHIGQIGNNQSMKINDKMYHNLLNIKP